MKIYTNIIVNSMKLYNVLPSSRMATRRLPATPILLFLIRKLPGATLCDFFLFFLPTLKLVKSTLMSIKSTLRSVKSTLKLVKSTF